MIGRTVLAVLLLASPTLGQTGSVPGNFNLADTKNKDPSLVAASHLSRAERAMQKARRLESRAGEKPKAAAKARKAWKRAEREAGAALGNDPGLVRAYLVRGQARLALGTAEGARRDCLRYIGFEAEDAEGLYCYGRASLEAGSGGQALSALARLLESHPDGRLTERLQGALEGWIESNPDGEAERNAALWLEQNAG